MITEIYVPRDRLADFMGEVADDFRRTGVDVVYGTIRLIERDDVTFLPWAREPWACVIFNLHTVHTPAGLEHAEAAFRRLIDMAIARGGSYFLTYHRWARPEQVEACYPEFRDFLAAKRTRPGRTLPERLVPSLRRRSSRERRSSSPRRARALVLIAVVLDVPRAGLAREATHPVPGRRSARRRRRARRGCPAARHDVPRPAWVFVNGAHPLRRREPVVWRLAQGLARAGYVVGVPDIPGLGDGTITVANRVGHGGRGPGGVRRDRTSAVAARR